MKRFAAVIVGLVGALVLTSCYHANFLVQDTDQVSLDRMSEIVDALSDHDAAALKGMFTPYAVAEYSAEIDAGMERLLTLFPVGGVGSWEQETTHASDNVSYGQGTRLVSSSYRLSWSGREYSLSFDEYTLNDYDHQAVGLYTISAGPWRDSEQASSEAALWSWGRTIDNNGPSGPPGIVIAENNQPSRDRIAQIIDALKAQDAAALSDMFTKDALAEYSAEIDSGLQYLLSLFADGDIVWQPEEGAFVTLEQFDGLSKTVLLPSFYRVTSGGVDYQFFFADFTKNTIHPDNVGIYAMGAVPVPENLSSTPEAYIYDWTMSFDVDASRPPGIYIPREYAADSRMEKIATALNSHDAAALKAMFSKDVLEQTPQIDEGLDYLLSFFPDGGISWTQDPAATTPVQYGSYLESGNLTEWVLGTYKLSADGNEYWLFFSGATRNDVNADDVGLESLGVTPWVEDRYTYMPGPPGQFFDWTNEDRYPGVYVPKQR